MSKYKAGDKIVLEILQENYGDYKVGDETDAWWIYSNHIEATAEPLSEYTDPLNDKIKRQAAEITRLLAENEELKEKLHEEHHELVWQDGYSHGVNSESEKWKENVEIIRDAAFEAGMIKGQQEAWKLALKLRYMDYEDKVECFGLEYDGKEKWIEIMEKYTYTEAAAKVAEYERQKEEICVGDVVLCEGIHGLVFGVGEVYIKGITPGCTPFQWHKQNCNKTGRHIDVNAWLAQIGGESDD